MDNKLTEVNSMSFQEKTPRASWAASAIQPTGRGSDPFPCRALWETTTGTGSSLGLPSTAHTLTDQGQAQQRQPRRSRLEPSTYRLRLEQTALLTPCQGPRCCLQLPDFRERGSQGQSQAPPGSMQWKE